MNRSLTIILGAGIIISIIIGILIFQNKNLSDELSGIKNNPTKLLELENKKIITNISKHIAGLENEETLIVNVSEDATSPYLAYFPNAQSGYKIVLYKRTSKLILYDPITDRIIDVSSTNNPPPAGIAASQNPPIANTGNTNPIPTLTVQPTVTPTPALLANYEVVIYNGAGVAGLASSYEKSLKTVFPLVTVIQKSDAKTKYKESLLIDLSGKNSPMTDEIASRLQLKTALLPATETKPMNGDYLIILGEDKKEI